MTAATFEICIEPTIGILGISSFFCGDAVFLAKCTLYCYCFFSVGEGFTTESFPGTPQSTMYESGLCNVSVVSLLHVTRGLNACFGYSCCVVLTVLTNCRLSSVAT